MSLINMDTEFVSISKLLLANLAHWMMKMFVYFSFFHDFNMKTIK